MSYTAICQISKCWGVKVGSNNVKFQLGNHPPCLIVGITTYKCVEGGVFKEAGDNAKEG